MNIGRKQLDHEVPEGVSDSLEDEVFFITICCEDRARNVLAHPEVWSRICEAMRHFEDLQQLKVNHALAMPDHFHALWVFPGDRSMAQVVAAFKRWVARHGGVDWQRGFFDHRVRGWESGAEKAKYIRQNPVRAGLVEQSEDWPYKW